MTWPVGTKNTMLDALTVNKASLHSAFPGTTGLNEISGGSYARQTVALNAAAGGQRLLNAAVTFPVPACTVRWVGYWNNDTFIGCAPNGGATPKNFMSVQATDVIDCAAHGYADTQQIVFFGGAPPAPLVEGTVYFVRDATTDSFKVASTSGGTAINLTAGPSFGCVVSAITEDEFVAGGTHTLSSTTFAIPD